MHGICKYWIVSHTNTKFYHVRSPVRFHKSKCAILQPGTTEGIFSAKRVKQISPHNNPSYNENDLNLSPGGLPVLVPHYRIWFLSVHNCFECCVRYLQMGQNTSSLTSFTTNVWKAAPSVCASAFRTQTDSIWQVQLPEPERERRAQTKPWQF